MQSAVAGEPDVRQTFDHAGRLDYGHPIPLSFLGRQEIRTSWEAVRKHGGHAVGIDGVSHRMTFGIFLPLPG